jgi:apolipoprotein N-acyltransferase
MSLTSLYPLLNSSWAQRTFVWFLGALSAGALAPLSLIPLLIPSFCGVLGLALYAKPKHSFWLGWWFGFGYFTAGLYWIAFALGVDIQRFGWMIPLSILGLPALLALFIAPVFAIISSVRLPKLERLFLFAALWALFEWLRGHLFTGFPWNLIGYSWVSFLPVSQSLSLFGIYGLSFFTVLWATAPLLWPRLKEMVGIYLILLLFTLFGLYRLNTTQSEMVPNVSLRLVQPAIPQKLKWSSQHLQENLQILSSLTKASSPSAPTLYIWPESATPFFLADDANRRLSLTRSLALESILLTGTTRGIRLPNGIPELWNSLIAIDSKGQVIETYDKAHLVPFGEYVPFRSFLSKIIHKVTPGSIDFSAGLSLKTLQLKGVPPFSPLICYEIIFPGKVKSLQQPTPQWILNITNDAWYGNTSGPYQHFEIARARAIEEGLPLVRVGNNGISGVIDSYGRVIGKMDLNERNFLDVNLPKCLSHHTFYFYYGDYIFFLMICTIISFIILKYIYLAKNKDHKN